MFFNVRVYGILKNADGDILVSDEFIQGNLYTKFCGGGMEFGEGTRECLIREYKEELGIAIEVGEHIYTTDFFMESKFANNQQVISIYYEVTTKENLIIPVSKETCDAESFFKNNKNGNEKFRFMPRSFFNENAVSLPADKIVARILAEK